MKKIITLAFILLLGGGTQAQTLIDTTLNYLCMQSLVEGTSSFESDINYMGVIIMESKTGNVLANVSVGYDNMDVVDIPDGNSKPLHAGIGRAVLYLTMMDKLKPQFIVDVSGGIYKDSLSGEIITDHNYKFGGYGRLLLKTALDRSDIGMIKAAEVAFLRDMGLYGAALRKTGVFFSDEVYEIDDASDSDQLWSPRDILGYTTYMSLIEQTAWVNAVANGGNLVVRENKNDSLTPICQINNKAGLDSLKSAMLDIVKEGLGLKMKSFHTDVAGIANVSQADVEGNRDCLAIAFFPYNNPQYIVGVNVNKHGVPAGRIIPTRIAGNIINFMAEHYLEDKKETAMMSASDPRQERIRPYEK